VVSDVFCAHLDPGRAEGLRNEKEAFKGILWTGVYWRMFNSITDEESSYSKKAATQRKKERTQYGNSIHRLDSHTYHQGHSFLQPVLNCISAG